MKRINLSFNSTDKIHGIEIGAWYRMIGLLAFLIFAFTPKPDSWIMDNPCDTKCQNGLSYEEHIKYNANPAAWEEEQKKIRIIHRDNKIDYAHYPYH